MRSARDGKFGRSAILLLMLTAMAIGLGSAGDAVAIDLPQLLQKAKKPPVKGPRVAPRQKAPGVPAFGQKRPPAMAIPPRTAVRPTIDRNARTKAGNINTGPANARAPNARPLNATSALDKNGRSKTANTNVNTRTANTKPPLNDRNARSNNANAKTANTRTANTTTANAKTAIARTASARPTLGRDPRSRMANLRTPVERQTFRATHRGELFAARARLPQRPFPGERNFTGVPPVGETRFVSTELVFQAGPNVSQQAVDDVARRFGLTTIGTQRSALTGGTLLHFRVADGRAVAEVVRALEAERLGIAQPNYVYQLYQSETAATQTETASSDQYVAGKLRLAEVHKLATGKDVLIAIIDSEVDNKHPELANAIVEKFDAVGKIEKPHNHGTGMSGAIVAHGRLMGIAPGARVLAIHAFSTTTQQSPQATTRNIVAGLEWALDKGARVINMSFAGPYDPMLQLAIKKASERGAVLIAAAGNMGPKSPPLYPAADPHVIGVTATDEGDKLYSGANQGPYVAVAAPGVDIMVPAPDDTYQITTGTSVAAAHVSGVAALLLERQPTASAATILEVLTASARKLGADGRDDRFGWGLIDPAGALEELDARIADTKVAAAPVLPRPAAALPRPVQALPRPAAPLPRPPQLALPTR